MAGWLWYDLWVEFSFEERALSTRKRPGPKLSYCRVMPKDKPRALIGLLHGYADHAVRYTHVMQELARQGIGVIALDMRGHGKAEGARGFCMDFREFLDDGAELRSLIMQEQASFAEAGGAVPAFLFGHSFGGLVATFMALEDATPWQGLLLSGPFYGLAAHVPAIKIFAGKLLGQWVPSFSMPSGLAGKDVTHDPVLARGYDEDPLVFKKANTRWYVETTAAQERLRREASNLKLPVRIGFGAADPVAKLASAREVFASFGSQVKEFHAYEELFHEILNEPSWKDVLADYIKFIDVRLAAEVRKGES
jgi:alpha-beta hydrolase superfamily lysophospholipase